MNGKHLKLSKLRKRIAAETSFKKFFGKNAYVIYILLHTRKRNNLRLAK